MNCAEKQRQRLEFWEKQGKDKFRKETFPPRVVRDLQQELIPLQDILDLMECIAKEKKGVYIYAPPGTGKTLLAASVLEQIKKECSINSNLAESSYGKCISTGFITVARLLMEFRDTFHNPVAEYTEKQILEKYVNIDWLILDDLGVEKNTDWSFQLLHTLTNERYENLKRTIMTSNFGLPELGSKLEDDRIPSRIRSMCVVYRLVGMDQRK
jgi:DNA replication protein DnaC